MHVLLELGEINWKQRVELTHALENENETGSEKILMAIDKLETIKKCKVYGRLSKLKALGQIKDIDIFLRLTKLIQEAYLDDLILVPMFDKMKEEIYSEGDFFPLLNLGLLFQQPSGQNPIHKNPIQSENELEYIGAEIKFNYLLSDLGNNLLKHYYELFPEDKNIVFGNAAHMTYLMSVREK